MKKGLPILILCLMLFSSVGLHLTIHHCGGDTIITLYGVEFGKHCDCESTDDDCCKEQTVIVQSDQTDKTFVKIIAIDFNFMKWITLYVRTFSFYRVSTPHESLRYLEIVTDSSPPIYLSFNVFRI